MNSVLHTATCTLEALEVVTARGVPADRNPVLTYLARLSPGSVRTQRAALETIADIARAQGLAVLPFCPFVRGFIDGHREYLDLVPVERRAKFGLDDG
jgi:aryl-alcohol dehydrogenase-like predicted oxidoreductase